MGGARRLRAEATSAPHRARWAPPTGGGGQRAPLSAREPGGPVSYFLMLSALQGGPGAARFSPPFLTVSGVPQNATPKLPGLFSGMKRLLSLLRRSVSQTGCSPAPPSSSPFLPTQPPASPTLPAGSWETCPPAGNGVYPQLDEDTT